ncbi:exonuclease [Salicola phage SCTP-2]|nr:exonuclease [Salicola phage SCTP-2]
MISIKSPFTYPVVKDESTTENGRVYFIRHNNFEYDPLYSVTTIISRMSNVKDAVEEWKNLIGHDKANQIISKSTNIGDRMHDILHYRLTETPNYENKFKKNFLFEVANKLANNIQSNYLEKKLTELWGSETPLFIPQLYAGRADLIGVYNGKPSIIDFKNSYKDKKEEHMENYFLQSAAYAVAHNYLYNTDIDQFVILFGNSTDFTVSERIVTGDEFNYWKNRWLNILKDFFE